MTEPPMTEPPGTQPPVLRARGIAKSFGGRAVLKGIDLDAQRGDVVSILGGSGSGKSTFLRCLNLLELPDAGSIEIAGIAAPLEHDRQGRARIANPRALGALRARTAMVFQNFNLWSHMTVLDNIVAAPVHVHGTARAEAVDRAHGLLEKVGMAGFAAHWPRQLSGGQQQRVAIAQCCAASISMPGAAMSCRSWGAADRARARSCAVSTCSNCPMPAASKLPAPPRRWGTTAAAARALPIRARSTPCARAPRWCSRISTCGRT